MLTQIIHNYSTYQSHSTQINLKKKNLEIEIALSLLCAVNVSGMLIKFVLLQFLFLLPSLLSSHLIESEFKNVFAFPKNFSFGASSAAYQVEGGFDADGKGPSIWDTLVHDHPEMIFDGTSGDVGDDSYHQYMEDVKALNEVGVRFVEISSNFK